MSCSVAPRAVEPAGRDHVGLGADDRREVGLASGLVEVEDAVHVPVVGDADRGLAVGRGLGHDVLDPGRAVEHRVLGVQVEVHERLGQRFPPGLRLSLVHSPSTGLWMNHTGVVRRPCTARAAAGGDERDLHLGRGQRPVGPEQLRLVGQRRIDEADAGTRPRARRRRRAGTWPTPGRGRATPRRAAARGGTPTRRLPWSSPRGRDQVGRAPVRACRYRKRPSPA